MISTSRLPHTVIGGTVAFRASQVQRTSSEHTHPHTHTHRLTAKQADDIQGRIQDQNTGETENSYSIVALCKSPACEIRNREINRE